ncbi:hypothetical protein BYT27DRAFT_7206223 [Phlegmacium glaucopus]|nr:hypothetical protein BYT27DRAFT_7206223 [Phlegmacium glaucopus]
MRFKNNFLTALSTLILGTEENRRIDNSPLPLAVTEPTGQYGCLGDRWTYLVRWTSCIPQMSTQPGAKRIPKGWLNVVHERILTAKSKIDKLVRIRNAWNLHKFGNMVMGWRLFGFGTNSNKVTKLQELHNWIFLRCLFGLEDGKNAGTVYAGCSKALLPDDDPGRTFAVMPVKQEWGWN